MGKLLIKAKYFCITDDKTEFFNAIAGDFEGFEEQDNKAVDPEQRVHLEVGTHMLGGILEVQQVEDNNLVGGTGRHLVGEQVDNHKA